MGKDVARSGAIDGLRGVAILMVLIAHLPFSSVGMDGNPAGVAAASYPPAWISQWMSLGHYGVQLFLVISGFCIHLRWSKTGDFSRGLNFASFWRRRLVRLYPPYLLVVAACLALVLICKVYPAQRPEDLLLDLAMLLLFAQNLGGAPWRIGNGPLWSLALEEQLYLLYFPLLWHRRRFGWPRTFFVLLLITGVWLGLVSQIQLPIRWTSAAPAYWFPWALGALAVEAHLGLVQLPHWTAFFSSGLVLGVAGLLLPNPAQSFFVTCSFFFLIRAALRFEMALRKALVWKALTFLGLFSYSVYLIHQPIFVIVKRLAVGHIPDLAILILRPVSALGIGWLFFISIERPFLQLSQKVRVE